MTMYMLLRIYIRVVVPTATAVRMPHKSQFATGNTSQWLQYSPEVNNSNNQSKASIFCVIFVAVVAVVCIYIEIRNFFFLLAVAYLAKYRVSYYFLMITTLCHAIRRQQRQHNCGGDCCSCYKQLFYATCLAS